MTDSSIYTSGEYEKNNPTWHETDSLWKAQNIISMLTRNSVLPSRICDVGCGAGEVLRALSEAFPDSESFGYEVSPQAFSLAKDKASDRLHFFDQDVFASEEHFDVALAIDVFEHVDDYVGFLQSMQKLAEIKVYHIPLDISAQMVIREKPLIQMRYTIGHIHSFTKGTALATLEYTGHEIIDWIYTAGSIDLPNRGLKANMAKVPRRLLFSMAPDLAVRLLGGYSLLVICK